MTKIAVIGAGVVGLSTAVQLQRALPNASITVVADRLQQQTTSDGAAGLFRPNLKLIPGVPHSVLKDWCRKSWQFFHELVHSEEASQAGAAVLTCYHITSDPTEDLKDPVLGEVVYDYKDCNEKELQMFPGGPYASGTRFTTIIVEPRWYLPYLMNKYFAGKNASLQIRKVQRLEEFAGQYDVVVNCTGIGSRELVGDTTMRAIRGQMLRVQAPWMKTALMINHNCWVVPGRETVVVGGTRQKDDYNEEISEEDAEEMWERACIVVPSLKKATKLWTWVGLRPHREPVRVEKETIPVEGGILKVVHNYGHGGNGISLSWGTSHHACRLVQELLSSHAKL